MDVATLVHNYGYAAVFVGSFLEGETVAALGGLAANRGYLALPWVIVIAAAGGFLSDQVFFGVGRLGGVRVVARFPNLCPSVERATRLLHRYAVSLIISIRFMYGLRIVGPMAIGMSGIHWLQIRALELRRGDTLGSGCGRHRLCFRRDAHLAIRRFQTCREVGVRRSACDWRRSRGGPACTRAKTHAVCCAA